MMVEQQLYQRIRAIDAETFRMQVRLADLRDERAELQEQCGHPKVYRTFVLAEIKSICSACLKILPRYY